MANISYSRQQVADACRKFAARVEMPEGLIGAGVEAGQLLWAISGNESSFGANCTPRHEPAYDVGGRYEDKSLIARFGRAAACSYGPWQVMFVNCKPGVTPDDLMGPDGLDVAADSTVYFLSRQLARWRPTTLAAVGAIWNGGSPRAIVQVAVQAYANQLEQNYRVAMPGPASDVSSTSGTADPATQGAKT